MKKGFQIKDFVFFAFLIILFALLSAFLYNDVPAINSPNGFRWYLLIGVTLFLIGEYAIYENFLSSRIGWSIFMLGHFVIFNALGIAFVQQIGYINLRPFFVCLAANSVVIFRILRRLHYQE